MLLALHAEGFIAPGLPVLNAILILMRALAAFPRELPQLLELADTASRICEQGAIRLDHPAMLDIRSWEAGASGELGKVGEALARHEALLADRLRILGPDHPDTLATRNHLAHWLAEAGRVDEAISQYEALLADLLRILGPDHPDTFITRNHLARRLGEAGRVDEAISRLETLLTDCLRILGPDDPQTLRHSRRPRPLASRDRAGGRGHQPIRGPPR